jgi:hypothetical protein
VAEVSAVSLWSTQVNAVDEHFDERAHGVRVGVPGVVHEQDGLRAGLCKSHPHALVDCDQGVLGSARPFTLEQHGVDRQEPAEVAQHLVNASRIRLGVA